MEKVQNKWIPRQKVAKIISLEEECHMYYLYRKKMASKKDILNKLKILITRRFKSDEDAFNYFNKDSNLYLDKSEVIDLLKEAGVNRWLTSLAAGQIISKFDEDGNDQLDWKEFKKAIKALSNEENW